MNFKHEDNRAIAIHENRIPETILFDDGQKCAVLRKNYRRGNNALDNKTTLGVRVSTCQNGATAHMVEDVDHEIKVINRVMLADKNENNRHEAHEVWDRDDFTLLYIGKPKRGANKSGTANLTGFFCDKSRKTVTVKVGQSALAAFHQVTANPAAASLQTP